MKVSDVSIQKYPLGPKQVPDGLLQEDMALYNHGMTLQELNEQGGMSYGELYCNVNNISLRILSTHPNLNYCNRVALMIRMYNK